MKKLGILALLLAVMMIISSVALAYEYSGRYGDSTLKKGHGGKNSPHLKQYVANVQGDVNWCPFGNCGTVDGIYGNNTVNGVKDYQRYQDYTPKELDVDGQAGFNTKTSLYSFSKGFGNWAY